MRCDAATTGARLGPYEVLAPLGAGGMGEVYRARDTRLEREVAIKVLPAELASDAERLKRFEKEARSASALNHPNIVTIYDIGSEGGVSYIAMERVEGATLRELLAGGALPMKKLLPIATQIAEGLAKAHEAGIVHRDLKPENVMVTKDGLVKILDFGLAKLTSTLSGSGEGSNLPTMTGTTPGVVVGTVGYMSPEQASGEAAGLSVGPVRPRLDPVRDGDGEEGVPEEDGDRHAGGDPERGAGADRRGQPADAGCRCAGSSSGASPRSREQRYASTDDLARDLATVRDHLSEAVSGGTRRRARRAADMALKLSLAGGRCRRESPCFRAKPLEAAAAVAPGVPAPDLSEGDPSYCALFPRRPDRRLQRGMGGRPEAPLLDASRPSRVPALRSARPRTFSPSRLRESWRSS